LLIILLVIAVLLAANALYVGAEFATVGVRRHRVQRKVEEGSLRARMLLPVLSDSRRLNRYLSTCQLGITASTLILGAYARRVLGDSLAPLFESSGLARVAAETMSFALILTVITSVQVVVTEQVPKSIVLRHPLRWSMALVIPLRVSEWILAGFIWVLQGSADRILKLLGFSVSNRPHRHSPVEIGLIVAESARVGVVRRELEEGVRNALRFTTRTARDLMVPRVRVRGVPHDASLPDLLRVYAESGLTRLPVYRGSLDVIEGVVHAKDVLLQTARAEPPPPLYRLLRPVLAVPWSVRSGDLLEQMREARTSIAVVLDEHGGTAGVVTLEDLVEEVVGEVEDEFDSGQLPEERLEDGRLSLRGEMPLTEANERFGLSLPSEEARTLGGLIMESLGRVALTGDVVTVEGHRLEVARMDGRRIETVRITPRPDEAGSEEDAS
jgi:CBS domain containing-hemolysin-like protein